MQLYKSQSNCVCILLTSFLVQNFIGKHIRNADFNQQVVEWLVGEVATPKPLQPVATFHYLFPIPASEKKSTPSRRCCYCSTPKKRKETRYMCVYCIDTPALCIYPCFVEYHKDIGVAAHEHH